MKLIIPAILEEAYLDRISSLPISHLYGAVAGDIGLRANQWLPQPAADDLAEFVSTAHSSGISFFYCLNVACLANREFTAEGQRWLVERLGWLSDCGVDGVILSNPYLIAFARKRFKNLQLAVSTAAAIDSVDKAQFLEK